MKHLHPWVWLLLVMIAPLAVRSQLVPTRYLLIPDQVFDGQNLHKDWVVFIEGNRIVSAGPRQDMPVPEDAAYIQLPGQVLMPGMIEGHGHLFLYPYDQQPWNNQVLMESQSLRVARATVHARNTLMAGFTTFRDLGTEGAGYADVGLKEAIERGVIPGPRLIIATRAIVATGSYGPKGFAVDHQMPVGAEVADGYDQLIKTVRTQIGKGADIIKIYADYRWGPQGEAQPTFTQQELELIVSVANSSGREVVAHAATEEGMRRAILAGVQTIEHGDGATEEILKLMVERKVALCATLAAADAISQYRGWNPNNAPDPARIVNKKKVFAQALRSGVPICAGGDVGVFKHGDNVRELELMVAYGMPVMDVIRASTSGNARILGLPELGVVAPGMLADLIAVPEAAFGDISKLRQVSFVMKDGQVFKLP